VILAIDFDGTLVEPVAFADVTTPLRLIPGAREALQSIKRAGHVVIVYSARANRALRVSPQLDPLVRLGLRQVNDAAWLAARPLHQARFDAMLRFCDRELRGLVDVVDDGEQGKPIADVYLDDRALRYGHGHDGNLWSDIALHYGV
jgi:beta-phosphoglucomutase-like phosphatase (HAD superfamily)